MIAAQFGSAATSASRVGVSIKNASFSPVSTITGTWLSARPELAGLELGFEAAGVRGRRVERVPLG